MTICLIGKNLTTLVLSKILINKKVKNENKLETKGIEVGHIFHFGQKYSKPMNATITNEKGQNSPVFMGSYGVGVSRLVGGIIEANHDKNGIIWPKEVSPFMCSLINLNSDNKECLEVANKIYDYCNKKMIYFEF